MNEEPLDPKYEVDAPKFYDFANMSGNCSKGDSWFEHHIEDSLTEEGTEGSGMDKFRTPDHQDDSSGQECYYTPAVQKQSLKDITNQPHNTLMSSTKTVLKTHTQIVSTEVVQTVAAVERVSLSANASARNDPSPLKSPRHSSTPVKLSSTPPSSIECILEDISSVGEPPIDSSIVSSLSSTKHDVGPLLQQLSDTIIKEIGLLAPKPEYNTNGASNDEDTTLLSSLHPNSSGRIVEAGEGEERRQERGRTMLRGREPLKATSMGPMKVMPSERGRSAGRPMTHKGIRGRSGSREPTIPKPFSFDRRDNTKSVTTEDRTLTSRPRSLVNLKSLSKESASMERPHSSASTTSNGSGHGASTAGVAYQGGTHKTTKPIAPNFQTDKRLLSRRAGSVDRSTLAKPANRRYSRPLPDFSKLPPVPSKSVRPPTIPLPFAFAERDKDHQAKMEKWRGEQIEKEKKQLLGSRIRASPMPNFDIIPAPKPRLVHSVQATKPIAPRFLTDKIVEAHKQKEAAAIAEDALKIKSSREFHAKPANVLKRKPFTPEKKERPRIRTLPVKLATEERQVHWKKLSEAQKEKKVREEAKWKQAEMERVEREKHQLSLLRKQTQFRAKPITSYPPIQVQRTSKPLTVPETPNFAKDKKSSN